MANTCLVRKFSTATNVTANRCLQSRDSQRGQRSPFGGVHGGGSQQPRGRLKEMVEPQNWSSADLPLATRRAFQRLCLQCLTVLQAKFLRVLPWWRRRIHQALEHSRDILEAIGESQRKAAEKLMMMMSFICSFRNNN